MTDHTTEKDTTAPHLRFVNFGLRTESEAYLLVADEQHSETVIPLTQGQLARLITKAAQVLQDMDHEPRFPPGLGRE